MRTQQGALGTPSPVFALKRRNSRRGVTNVRNCRRSQSLRTSQ
jgi:hypothetical protein